MICFWRHFRISIIIVFCAIQKKNNHSEDPIGLGGAWEGWGGHGRAGDAREA